ncbi:hypothetical protein [Microbacterium sp. KR10-403]|uniref:hypothetical protein n=1 Tax=Microbacterium sp. KR10-403 TaxID=3158581 RepID=UPI0032E4A2D0
MGTDLAEDLAALLYRVDPLGLVPIGVPADEYRAEAEAITRRLGEVRTVEDLERIAHEEFVAWFSPELAGARDRYTALAHEAWTLI